MKRKIVGHQLTQLAIVIGLTFGLFACAPTSSAPDQANVPFAPDFDQVDTATQTLVLPSEAATPIQESLPTLAPTEPVDLAISTPKPADTPMPTQTPVPTASQAVAAAVGERYAVVGVELRDVLNVRDGAGVDNEIVAELPATGTDIRLSEGAITVDGSQWVQVQAEGVSGWVNGSFLAVQVGTAGDSADAALSIIHALKTEDFATLSTFVHPEKGARFTPYAYVRDADIVFNAAEIAALADNETVFLWGRFDGTGDPINLTFADYYLGFIYDVDFFRPHSIGFDEFIGYSNDINNVREFYPEAEVVEYYFPGFNERYDGMDWRGLRLILEEENGAWYLVGVVHTEWTI